MGTHTSPARAQEGPVVFVFGYIGDMEVDTGKDAAFLAGLLVEYWRVVDDGKFMLGEFAGILFEPPVERCFPGGFVQYVEAAGF